MRIQLSKLFQIIAVICAFTSGLSLAGPEEDRKNMLDYYAQRFPELDLSDYANGAYALSESAYAQWQEIEEFPPYEFAVEEGQSLFEEEFADGGTYADCFENRGIGIRQNYPYYDEELGEVVTLELAINQCRVAHNAEPLPYMEGDLAAISAYMTYTSRGETIDVAIQSDGALAAYESGKEFYFSKRGQLNFSCADCHVRNAGLYLRADQLSPSLGHTTHFPVYRSKWGEIGTLHRRFAECNSQVRAVPQAAQSLDYRDLEFFLAYLGNGIDIDGPGARK